MAIIGKIREKSGLVMIIIGLGMVGFLFQDAATSLFNGGGNTNVGEVGEVTISAIDFDKKLNEFIARYEFQNGPANAQVRESIREQVWNDIVREELLVKEFNMLGIEVSPKELDDMITGANPHPQIKQSFTNPETNVFDPNQVITFLKGLDNMPADRKAQWLQFEDGLIQERVATKYNTMVTKGMFATSLMIKNAYVEQTENRAIKYVVKRYNTIPDSAVTVSESDLKAYYEEHKHQFKQDASRSIEYVRFDVYPSDEDKNEVKAQLAEIAKDFKTTNDDSSFVASNSDVPTSNQYYTQNDFPFGIDSAFFHAEKGEIFGPYEENNTFAIAKLADIKFAPDSVKARHILVNATTPGDSTGYFKLDSLRTLIKKGTKFDQLAKDNSDDVGSAVEGGDLGWFVEGTMVKPFNDACFNGKKGDLVIVESQFGFHLIEILDQAALSKKVSLAKIALNVVPSSETYDKVFAQVSNFYSENKTAEAFTATLSKENSAYKKMEALDIKVSDKTVSGISDSREMVRWVFNAEKGDVSDPMQFDNTYVVAHLSEIKQDGFASLEQIKNEIELEAKKKKKAEQISKEMAGILNIDDLATKIGVPVSTTSNVNFAAYSIPGLGQEPKVIGTVSTIPAGKMTAKPIEGATGVFVVLVESVTPAPETNDYTAMKQQLNSLYAGISSGILEALKEKFGVVDERYKFY